MRRDDANEAHRHRRARAGRRRLRLVQIRKGMTIIPPCSAEPGWLSLERSAPSEDSLCFRWNPGSPKSGARARRLMEPRLVIRLSLCTVPRLDEEYGYGGRERGFRVTAAAADAGDPIVQIAAAHAA